MALRRPEDLQEQNNGYSNLFSVTIFYSAAVELMFITNFNIGKTAEVSLCFLIKHHAVGEWRCSSTSLVHCGGCK
jgi:hypothetical protein